MPAVLPCQIHPTLAIEWLQGGQATDGLPSNVRHYCWEYDLLVIAFLICNDKTVLGFP